MSLHNDFRQANISLFQEDQLKRIMKNNNLAQQFLVVSDTNS